MITPLLKMKVIIVSICLFFYSFSIVAQNTSIFWQKSDTLNTKRKNTVYIAEAAAASVALIGLNQLWYAGFERSSYN
jgi:nucleoside recognition membrane protein YjiH